jgi:polyisoprenoid-binding protein YceI
MNKSITLLLLLTMPAFIASKRSVLHIDVYNVDISKSTLEWYAQKMSGKHNGTIMLSNGEIKNNHGNLTASFEIDMNTIVNKDMESETMKAKLENHLKSADFFDAAKFPKAKFVLTSMTPVSEGASSGITHQVKGNLTIKDRTNEISFGANISMLPDKITCSGSAVVDRSKFDVRYGSKSFFADIGDKMIYDEFTLKFEIVATKP